jgi:CyaY protein
MFHCAGTLLSSFDGAAGTVAGMGGMLLTGGFITSCGGRVRGPFVPQPASIRVRAAVRTSVLENMSDGRYMNESEFNKLADATLAAIEQAVERCGADIDFELQAGGVLELEFADGSKVVINRHGVAQEIWVAARSGGFHFRPEHGRWIGTRDGIELMTALESLLSQQAGTVVSLTASG